LPNAECRTPNRSISAWPSGIWHSGLGSEIAARDSQRTWTVTLAAGRQHQVFSIFLGSFCVLALLCPAHEAAADPIGLQWPQPGGKGTDVFITYSYSNLLDGSFLLLSPAELRAATEESLRLWATYAPLNFVERPDSGPPPSQHSYAAAEHPQIRVGHHPLAVWAHAYFPGSFDGLAGDIHLSTGAPWQLGETAWWNVLEILTHEVGHALGLDHELRHPAMMNPTFPRRYAGLGTAFLFPADIEDVQAIYGAGRGSVQPLEAVPEPSTFVLIAGGLVGAWTQARRRRRGR
jgi:hypothetical protein